MPSRDDDDSQRREAMTREERLITIGVAVELTDLMDAVKDHGRPGSLRPLANEVGRSFGQIDKYKRAARQIPLVVYVKAMKYLFDRLPPSYRDETPAGRVMQEPAVAAMVSSGLSDDTLLSSVLISAKAMHDTGLLSKNRLVPLYDHLIKLGEQNASRFP